MVFPDFQHAHDLIEHGEAAEALALLTPWAERLPAYAAAHVLRARAFEALGQTDEAHGAWQQAHFLMPNSPAVLDGLQRTRPTPPAEADAPLLDADAFLDLDDAPDEAEPQARGTGPAVRAQVEEPVEAAGTEPEAAGLAEALVEAEPDAAEEVPETVEFSEDLAEAGPEAADPVEEAFEADAEAAAVEQEIEAPPEDEEVGGAAAESIEEVPEAEPAPPLEALQAVRAALSAAEAAEAALPEPEAPPEPAPPDAAAPEAAEASIYAEIDALIQERQAMPLPAPVLPAEPEADGDLLDLDAWEEFDDMLGEPGTAQEARPEETALDEVTTEEEAAAGTVEEEDAEEDLDRLIQELESARIVPRPDLDDVPRLELDDDIDDVVSETLARIYASQGKFREAARIYETLAREQPDEAERLEEKAAEMRALAADMQADE